MQEKITMYGRKGILLATHATGIQRVQDGWNFEAVMFGSGGECLTQPADIVANTLIKVQIKSSEGEMTIAGFGPIDMIQRAKDGVVVNWTLLLKDEREGFIPYDITITAY